MARTNPLFAMAEAMSARLAAAGETPCGARDRNAKCARPEHHGGWHRSKTGVCWPAPAKDGAK